MLTSLRRLDDEVEAAVRRISIVKLVVTMIVVWSVTSLVMFLLVLVNP